MEAPRRRGSDPRGIAKVRKSKVVANHPSPPPCAPSSPPSASPLTQSPAPPRPFQAHFSHKFEHSWERVTQAFWLKYQSPRMPHIKEVIVLNRSVDELGRLSTRRLVVAQLTVPKILSSFVARRIDSWYAIEDTLVDPHQRLMDVTVRNLSYARVVEAVQEARYQPQPGAEDAATLYETKVDINCNSSLPWFLRNRAEAAMGKEQSRSYNNTLALMEDLCSALKADPDFQPSRSTTPSVDPPSSSPSSETRRNMDMLG